MAAFHLQIVTMDGNVFERTGSERFLPYDPRRSGDHGPSYELLYGSRHGKPLM